MRSGTSYFKTLLRSDWRRLWPIIFAYTLVWFFALPMMLWNRGHQFDPTVSRTVLLAGDTLSSLEAVVIGGACVALALAMGLFAYLMRSNSVGLMHALPVTRTQQFIAHFGGGMLMLTGANLLIVVLAALAELSCGGFSITALLWWLLTAELSELFFFALSAVCIMCTGWLLAVPVLFVGVNFVYGAYEGLLQTIAGEFYYGYTGYTTFSSLAAWLTPLVKLMRSVSPNYEYSEMDGGYMIRSMNPEGIDALLIYGVAAVLLTVVAWLFYKARHSEHAGDLLVFSWLKPIFRAVISLAGGLGLGMLVHVMINWDADDYAHSNGQFAVLILCQILMGIIVYLAVEMLLTKSYKVFGKKTLLRAGALCLGIVVVMLAVRFDITGYQKRTPDVNKVESVNICGILQDIDITEADGIEATVALHKMLIEAGDPTQKSDWDYLNSVDITYEMKDGSTFRRNYSYEMGNEQVTAAVNALLKIPEARRQALVYSNGAYGTDFTGGYITDYELGTSVYLDAEQCAALYAALEKDADSLKITTTDRNYSSHVDIALNTTRGDYNLKQLYRGCTHTIDLLIEYGLCDSADGLFYAYDEESALSPLEVATETYGTVERSAAAEETADE